MPSTCAIDTVPLDIVESDLPTPDFILRLREHVGHDLLWLSGVSVVVVDDDGRILLARRSDNGAWAVPAGILEPGEQPGPAALRELHEETGVTAELVRLAAVDVTPEITYPNGDRTQYLGLCFLARYVGGVAHPADDENSEVGWFAPDDLPAGLAPTSADRIAQALREDPEAWFAGREPCRPDDTGGASHGR